ncbi:fungal-specific transcription factor domain-containing protein [Xylariales sp. AK1849]|nr:fungal-specific transcription factor domain-containing protein [Xylariales sp. AK1849]
MSSDEGMNSPWSHNANGLEIDVSSRKGRPGDEEADLLARTNRSEPPGTEPLKSLVSPDRTSQCWDATVALAATDLRRGKKSSTRFVHEATKVDLAPGVVAELLEEYYLNKYPKFPLLIDATTIIESYDKAPLLFWSVLAIASKDSEKHASHHLPLHSLTRQLAADILLLGTRSIHLVQALLLLYVWSFPHKDMNKEPLSMYCAVAISMARSLGLHRPQHPFRFFAAKASEIGTVETRTITWLSCFIVDQWHTARFGVPSALKIDYIVLHALNNPMAELPTTMRIQLHIALVTSKMSAALGECETSATGLATDPLPVVRVLQTELCTIQEKYAAEWSPADEASFLDSRLSLYSYVLNQKLANTKRRHLEGLHVETELITQGSLAASQLLRVLITFPDALSRRTFHTFRCASYAVFFLLRIFGTAPSELIDEVDIRNVIGQIYTLMKEICQAENDRRAQCGRICRIIERMID